MSYPRFESAIEIGGERMEVWSGDPSSVRTIRRGWIKVSFPPKGCPGGCWQMIGAGYQVHHCGHQTANWPYTGVSPDNRAVLTPRGSGFARLVDAMIACEKAAGIAGKAVR